MNSQIFKKLASCVLAVFCAAVPTFAELCKNPLLDLAAPVERWDEGIPLGNGGAGALLSKSIKKCELIAYEDLGAEALRKLYVEDMPLVVIIDCEGNNLYETGPAEFLAAQR